MVWPTIWGKVVLARLHVRMTFFSPLWFSASTFLISLGCTYGPFFNDLPICRSFQSVPSMQPGWSEIGDWGLEISDWGFEIGEQPACFEERSCLVVLRSLPVDHSHSIPAL